MLTQLPPSPLPSLRAVELAPADAPLLQRFFDENPQYFLAVQGEPAGPGEATEEIAGELPPGVPHTRKWVIGYVAPNGALAGIANLVSDIFAPTVWNVSTFIIATARHGSGEAQALYKSLEAWAAGSGACWLRLGVVKGNTRGERFWLAQGFVDTRERSGYQIGRQVNVLRVMAKPLHGGSIDDYLSLVPRDRPEHANAL